MFFCGNSKRFERASSTDWNEKMMDERCQNSSEKEENERKKYEKERESENKEKRERERKGKKEERQIVSGRRSFQTEWLRGSTVCHAMRNVKRKEKIRKFKNSKKERKENKTC